MLSNLITENRRLETAAPAITGIGGAESRSKHMVSDTLFGDGLAGRPQLVSDTSYISTARAAVSDTVSRWTVCDFAEKRAAGAGTVAGWADLLASTTRTAFIT